MATVPQGGGVPPKEKPLPKIGPRKRQEKGNGYAYNPRTGRGS